MIRFYFFTEKYLCVFLRIKYIMFELAFLVFKFLRFSFKMRVIKLPEMVNQTIGSVYSVTKMT